MTDSQILEHSATSVDFTVFDVNWVPSSPRLVVCGSSLAGEGSVRVYSLAGQVSSVHPSSSRSKIIKNVGTGRDWKYRKTESCQMWDFQKLFVGRKIVLYR